MRKFFAELRHRDQVLFFAGCFQVALFGVAFVASLVDARTVLGINTWIKPMKFSLSVGVYIWTLTWLIGYFQGRPRWATGLIRWGVTSSMFIEIVCIFLQAARGTPSHFNISNDFDALLFAIMGIMIAVNMALVFILLILFLVRKPALPSVYLWSIRLGIVVFFLGSWIGWVMIGQMSHAVGVADGGPGLPLLGWSTVGGDLRIAHGLGLHALQFIPLLGYLISRKASSIGTPGQHALLLGGVVIYAVTTWALYLHAQAGLPLMSSG